MSAGISKSILDTICALYPSIANRICKSFSGTAMNLCMPSSSKKMSINDPLRLIVALVLPRQCEPCGPLTSMTLPSPVEFARRAASRATHLEIARYDAAEPVLARPAQERQALAPDRARHRLHDDLGIRGRKLWMTYQVF